MLAGGQAALVGRPMRSQWRGRGVATAAPSQWQGRSAAVAAPLFRRRRYDLGARRSSHPGSQRLRVMSDTEEGADASSYYSLLGVSPSASQAEIKTAYRSLMRDFHPDKSNDDDAVEFAVFLNDIYSTLLDPDRRAAYDLIAGFDVGGVNPFMDRTGKFEAEMAFVDEFTCIGCRNCNCVAPRTFEMEEEWGRARVAEQGVDSISIVQEAMDTCPVQCIHWCTAPQLAILEETMARMERVAAFVLMTGGGKGANLNVFSEASIAWEKRRSAMQASAERAARRPFWSPAAGATMQESAREAAAAGGADNGGGAAGSSPLGRQATAASIAKAARRWRNYQRAKRQKAQRFIGDGMQTK